MYKKYQMKLCFLCEYIDINSTFIYQIIICSDFNLPSYNVIQLNECIAKDRKSIFALILFLHLANKLLSRLQFEILFNLRLIYF